MFKKVSIIQTYFFINFHSPLYSQFEKSLFHYIWSSLTFPLTKRHRKQKSKSDFWERIYYNKLCWTFSDIPGISHDDWHDIAKKAICYVQNSFVFWCPMWPTGLQKLLELYTCTAIVKCKRKRKREEGKTGEGRLDEEESRDVMIGDERAEEWWGVARTTCRGVDRNGEGREDEERKEESTWEFYLVHWKPWVLNQI